MAISGMLRRPDGTFAPANAPVGWLADENDILVRQHAERMERENPTDTYKNETVTVELGKERRKIELRHPVGGKFIFACLADNAEWQSEPLDIWKSASGNALDKFCAIRRLSIVDGPKQEVDNRYNFFVETRQVVE